MYVRNDPVLFDHGQNLRMSEIKTVILSDGYDLYSLSGNPDVEW